MSRFIELTSDEYGKMLVNTHYTAQVLKTGEGKAAIWPAYGDEPILVHESYEDIKSVLLHGASLDK